MSSGYGSDLPTPFDEEPSDSQHTMREKKPDSSDVHLAGLSYVHFAIIYVDHSGKLGFEASPSIADSCQSILSPSVTETFLRAVAISSKDSLSGSSSPDFSYTASEAAREGSPLSPQSLDIAGTDILTRKESISSLETQRKYTNEVETETPLEKSHAGSRHAKRKKVSHECMVAINITCNQRAMLPLRDQRRLRRYYEKAFESLQQINCRTIAKAYVKLVEPRKQVNYPYNGRKLIAGVSRQLDPELTKPAWWPSGVTHKEPDHLPKAERVRLLIHILCELRDSRGITVGKLREADQSIRRQITPSERLQVLDEIYRVREDEESFLNGQLDPQAAVYVSRAHLPDDMDSSIGGSPGAPINDSDMNRLYRKEAFDMETHTSVFPSMGNLMSHTESANSRSEDTITHTSWDSCPPASSIPSLRVPQRGHDAATALSVPSPSIPLFHQAAPPSIHSFPLRFYHDPSISHGQQQQTSLDMSVPTPDVGHCAHPYYFNY
ncbi:DUF2841 domain-containing protein [Aspergillus clavatus NRRL 1]|uniref:Subtelomeric hrmA-associated cluster protein AFUB-079030/YDR124W-like helical bundle domain-containing protein n=1 Tax=Aspergillus clavatus (strain ATCC 1007 / CBS 513.65 / DSM 816 / NCTC 3887 / NRRL 1 / QM 1276 / 107) TaxID=344612 RepID=A1CUK3_ASPCL|nr:uncharacterized protein ACLA_086920 [Aspergillus clavatus NRRL 1]EAW06990.1 conserved hypothetical protein [Aspergillus clavatus NRRL 1]